MPKVLSGNKQHTKRRREKIYVEEHYHKVNADITQVSQQNSNYYKKYRLTGLV